MNGGPKIFAALAAGQNVVRNAAETPTTVPQ